MYTIRRVAPVVSGAPTYVAVYPPALSTTYIKATTATFDMPAHLAMDIAQPLSGDAYPYCWMSDNGNPSNQRFHIDLGEALVLGKIVYCNYHNGGYNVDRGANSITLQGSNSAPSFAELTYGTDTGWSSIAKSPDSMVIHTLEYDGAIWNTITVTSPSTAYRYYALKIASNHGDATRMGIRQMICYKYVP